METPNNYQKHELGKLHYNKQMNVKRPSVFTQVFDKNCSILSTTTRMLHIDHLKH